MSYQEECSVTEVPTIFKQLARLVVRGFYTTEDALIIDMLVRNPCLKEDDMSRLLKFDKKMLRARIAVLKNDKFIELKLKIETGSDGKAQRLNYYYINYKSFVNVVKYKLYLMRKILESNERDAATAATFKCTSCVKTFTDLEADRLFDDITDSFRCTNCCAFVEENESAMPKKRSHSRLATFNEELKPLYSLLYQVEDFKLASEICIAEPNINTIRGLEITQNNMRGCITKWSNETKLAGLNSEDIRTTVLIVDEIQTNNKIKEMPRWLIDTNTSSDQADFRILEKGAASAANDKHDEIMSLLLKHEKKGGVVTAVNELSDSSENEYVEE